MKLKWLQHKFCFYDAPSSVISWALAGNKLNGYWNQLEMPKTSLNKGFWLFIIEPEFMQCLLGDHSFVWYTP